MATKTPKKKPTPQKFDLRLHPDTRKRLDARAVSEQRSSNAQAVWYIEEGLRGGGPREVELALARIDKKLDLILELLQAERRD